MKNNLICGAWPPLVFFTPNCIANCGMPGFFVDNARFNLQGFERTLRAARRIRCQHLKPAILHHLHGRALQYESVISRGQQPSCRGQLHWWAEMSAANRPFVGSANSNRWAIWTSICPSISPSGAICISLKGNTSRTKREDRGLCYEDSFVYKILKSERLFLSLLLITPQYIHIKKAFQGFLLLRPWRTK